MSTKWKHAGTNSLEAYEPEFEVTDQKIKKAIIHNKYNKSFKFTHFVQKMNYDKPKKIYIDKIEVAEAS